MPLLSPPGFNSTAEGQGVLSPGPSLCGAGDAHSWDVFVGPLLLGAASWL